MSLHPLLKQQFEDARQGDGQLDLRKLLQAISTAYAEWDDERRGVVRSMKLLADETSAFTREVRESAPSQLQVDPRPRQGRDPDGGRGPGASRR
jgi:hypothetical protein